MKKLLASILALVLLVTLFGCSAAPAASSAAPSDTGSAPASDAQPGEKSKVVLWTWLANQQSAIDTFNGMQDDIEVELVQMNHTDIAQKLQIALAADTGAADLFQQPQRTFSNISKTEKLMDLTAVYEPHKAKFSEAITGLLTYNGKIYGMAPDVCPGVLWYRKDIFEANGIGELKTWSEFEAAGKKLADKGYYMMPVFNPAGTWGANAISMFMQSRGGNFFTADGKVIENNAELEFTLDWFNRMLSDELGIGLTFFTPEFWGEFKSDSIVAWPMNIAEGNNIKTNIPEQAGQWDVMPFPKWDDKDTTYTGYWGGTAFGIPEMSQVKEEALTYAEWLCTTTEGQIAMYDAWGSVPSNLEAITNDHFKKGDDFFSGNNPLANINEVPPFYYFDFATVESVVGEQVDLMFAGKQDPATTARNIEKNLKESTGR